MRHCPQPVISSVDGVCAGAARSIALFSDLRYAAPSAKVAFLFVRVGLAGCDMGACAMLPRAIGQGRAAELLYTGRSMSAEEGLAWASSTASPIGAHRAAGYRAARRRVPGRSRAAAWRRRHVAAGEPDANEEERHLGARRGVAQVGKQGNERARPGAHAVDRRDHRCAAMPHPLDQVAVMRVNSSSCGICHLGSGPMISCTSPPEQKCRRRQ